MELFSAMSNIISIGSLSLSYGGRVVFEDFSLDICRGETVVITADSGSGKTSLLNCIMGFCVPDSGHIEVFGVRLDADSVWSARRRMTMVQQEPEPGAGTVRSVIEMIFQYHANRENGCGSELLGELMDRFSISDELLDKRFSELSGGEKQRAALIAALLIKRDILLLDEVTSALDERNKRAVLGYLKSLPDVTIIAAAHDRAVYDIADRVVPLQGGIE